LVVDRQHAFAYLGLENPTVVVQRTIVANLIREFGRPRWDEREERYDQTYETTSFLTSVFHFQTS
jgi:hypothetical protein